jgi:Protein kinase domain/zinc-ribbon domain
MIKCIKCGTDLQDGTRFCGACGAQQDAPVVPKAASRKFDSTVFQGSGKPASAARPAAGPRQNDPALLQTMAAPAPASSPSSAARPAAPVRPSQVVIGSGEAATDPAAQPKVRENAPPAVAGDAVTPESVEAGTVEGRMLNGRYRVATRIGEGGFGTVFKAEQVAMGRECALKVLHPQMAKDPQVVGRFRREAQAASVLRSPHTVQIYDFDQTPEGVLYLAMELLHGVSLHSEMARGPLPWQRVVKILDGIGESLGEAHQQGIVHRDVKPENVFIEARGSERDYVKVLDFGIAKIVTPEGGGTGPKGPALTAVGQTLGTLEYMSPEQLMGLQLDGRSDLYACGILAFEMLVGALPFSSKSSGEMITAHLKTVPPAPSKVAPNAAIPPLLDAVILRLLEKDRGKRYRDTAELQGDLRRIASLGADAHAAPVPAAMVPAAPVAVAPVQPAGGMPAPVAAPAPMAKAPAPAAAPAKGGLSNTMLMAIAVGAVVILGVVAALLLMGGKAHGDEAVPAELSPARMVPASLGAFLAIDLPAVRAASPADAVQMLENALGKELVGVGGSASKIGKMAAGFDMSDAVTDEAKRGAVMVVDVPLDQKKAEAALKARVSKGEKSAKLTNGTYKGVKVKKGTSGQYAFLPGDRLVVVNAGEIGPVIDLAKGQGTPLVDGPAAAMLGKLGALGGKGPALIAWSMVTERMRQDLARQAPGASMLQELGGVMSVAPGQGADLKVIGRTGSEAEARKTMDSAKATLAMAKRDQTVALLGLAQLPDLVKVETEGVNVVGTLHLSGPQYADLFTRFAGLIAAAAEQEKLSLQAAPAAEGTPKKKGKAKKAE